MKIELREVVSSNIAAIGYDRDKHILRVKFKSSGAQWDYWPVPEEKYLTMMVAESQGKSVGSYFAKEIRANKNYEANEVVEDIEDTA